ITHYTLHHLHKTTLFPYTTLFRSKLPDTIIQSSYYIEDNNLILTKGRTGFVVNVDEMTNDLITRIQNLEVNNNQIELITEEQSRSEEHTSELQSRFDLVCRLLLEK